MARVMSAMRHGQPTPVPRGDVGKRPSLLRERSGLESGVSICVHLLLAPCLTTTTPPTGQPLYESKNAMNVGGGISFD